MVILRSLVPGVIFVSAVVAQQRASMLDCRDVEGNLERFTGKDRSLPEISRLLVRMLEGSSVDLFPQGGESALLMRGSKEQIDTAKAAVVQLRRADLQELRLQCTVVTMPLETATAAGLAAGKVLEVDEAKAGKVIKDAVAAKGTFCNLPEGCGLPLQPFVLGKPKEQRPGTAAEMVKGSQVRVEALPLSAAEVWFALQWTGELPGEKAGTTQQSQFEASLRLKVGNGAMLMSAHGKQAVVLWLRFPFTVDAQPAKGK